MIPVYVSRVSIQFFGTKEYLMRAHFGLPSITASGKTDTWKVWPLWVQHNAPILYLADVAMPFTHRAPSRSNSRFLISRCPASRCTPKPEPKREHYEPKHWWNKNLNTNKCIVVFRSHCALNLSKSSLHIRPQSPHTKKILMMSSVIHPLTKHTQVRYLKIIEKSGYQALPWVRYITKNGKYELRMT